MGFVWGVYLYFITIGGSYVSPCFGKWVKEFITTFEKEKNKTPN